MSSFASMTKPASKVPHPKHIMVAGTSSHAGKSVIASALCAIFSRTYKTTPFKAQNMSLNSWITQDGGEIGIAQAIQAHAAGIEPTVDMNPVLLKPKGDRTSQIVVLGKPYADRTAGEYYHSIEKAQKVVAGALDRLGQEYDVIIMEGAGGAAEINLYHRDIVNIGAARLVSPDIIIVGDIERGGVFASLYGTYTLLPDDVKAMVKGFIINKFRGDMEILRPGLSQLEELTGIPVLGVLPYTNIRIPSEDSVSIGDKTHLDGEHDIDIAVIQFAHISNFTDFEPLEDVANVRYVKPHENLQNPDLIILPGTKNTTADLIEMQMSGMDKQVIAMSGKVPVIGICGGYQMLGASVTDSGIEHDAGIVDGLGLLDIETVFDEYEKTTVQVTKQVTCGGKMLDSIVGKTVQGYEIHMGQTKRISGDAVFGDDGCMSEDGLVFGTYLHGLFANEDVTDALMGYLHKKNGTTYAKNPKRADADVYRELGEFFEEHVDMAVLRKLCAIDE